MKEEQKIKKAMAETNKQQKITYDGIIIKLCNCKALIVILITQLMI